jgi:thiopurine S-methyltransferase
MTSEAFWRERWAQGQIGFHEGAPNPMLSRFIDRLLPEPDGGVARSVFVPLCGKAVDLDVLASRGARVVGCELVSLAIEQYFSERRLSPARRDTACGPIFEAPFGDRGSIAIVEGDVFSFEPESSPFDAAFDRAAFVAIEPDRREAYARVLARALAVSAKLLLVTFEHDLGSGPPYSVPRDEVLRCFGEDFEVEPLADDDVLAQRRSFAERGATMLREAAYLLTRRSPPSP